MKKLVLLVSLVFFVAGCSGGLIRPKVESGIRDALPEYIGPAEKYEVEADGPSMEMLNGSIEHLRINGKKVQVDPNLLIDDLSVDMYEVRYDPGDRKLLSVQRTIFQAGISEASVNRYIQQTREGDSELKVKLDSSKVLVQFIPTFVGIDVPVAVAGKPMIASGDKINFVVDKASVGRLPVPAFVVNKVLNRINPIIDMSMMKFPVTLADISVKNEAVTIKGSARIKPAQVR